jgi:hypothetical protein
MKIRFERHNLQAVMHKAVSKLHTCQISSYRVLKLLSLLVLLLFFWLGQILVYLIPKEFPSDSSDIQRILSYFKVIG